ncbi:MAG: FTR1 family protein [Anaerolineales bacterium]
MLSSFLLALREGLEITLIVGILSGALHQFKRTDLLPTIRLGVASAVAVSLLAAILLNLLGASLEGDAEAAFEGVMMWTAAGVLTWMILWMQSRAARIKEILHQEVGQAARIGGLSIFLVAFVAVLREGVELALFLTASVFTSDIAQTMAGALVGIAAAVLIGWGIFRASIRLNVKRFFQVTSVLLIFFAAGLVAHGTHEFNEIGLIPGIVDPLWDVNGILDENSIVGQILRTLFGYNGDPSLSEMISYALYFAILYLVTRPRRLGVMARQEVSSG